MQLQKAETERELAAQHGMNSDNALDPHAFTGSLYKYSTEERLNKLQEYQRLRADLSSADQEMIKQCIGVVKGDLVKINQAIKKDPTLMKTKHAEAIEDQRKALNYFANHRWSRFFSIHRLDLSVAGAITGAFVGLAALTNFAVSGGLGGLAIGSVIGALLPEVTETAETMRERCSNGAGRSH